MMFVHREEYYCTREEAVEKGIAGQADIIVAKQRNGPTGDIKLAWFASTPASRTSRKSHTRSSASTKRTSESLPFSSAILVWFPAVVGGVAFRLGNGSSCVQV